MPSRTGHPGTRRAHTRKGKPVRSASIKYPQTQRRRNQVSRQVRQGRKPLLWGAGTLAGLGALEAILGGRFFTAAMLFGLAGGFLVGHVVWQHHKKRQVSKPARVSAAEQRRQARAKARQERQRRDGGMTDEDIQKLHESSTRTHVRLRAAKEGARRRFETLFSGKEYADKAAAERKAALRWPERSGKPNPAPALAEPVRVGLDSRPAPQWKPSSATEPTTRKRTQLEELVHPDTEASRKFYALRESGYKGPIDQDGNKVTSGPEFDILQRMQR